MLIWLLMGITEFLLLKLHCASLVFVSSELKLGFGIYFLVYLKNTAVAIGSLTCLSPPMMGGLTFLSWLKLSKFRLCVYFSTRSLTFSVLLQLQDGSGFACHCLQQHECVSHRVNKALETQSRYNINCSLK